MLDLILAYKKAHSFFFLIYIFFFLRSVDRKIYPNILENC